MRRLKRLGFRGPFAGGKHEYFVRGAIRLAIPNPHQSDIDPPLLNQILKEAGISRDDWDRVS